MRLIPHVHDYEMVFHNGNSLNHHLICKCGDRCETTSEALDKTWHSRDMRQLFWITTMSLLILAVAVLIIWWAV